MLNAIHTYNIYESGFTLNCPKDFKALCIRVIDGTARMYAAVNPSSVAVSRRFIVVTENMYSAEDLTQYTYVDSYKPRDGFPVMHVFDTTPIPGPLEQLASCGEKT